MFHVTNPNVESWSGKFANSVISLFPPSEMRLVSFSEWLTLLRKSAKDAATTEKGEVGIENNPALLLIDFLSSIGGQSEGPRVLRHERAEAASRELRGVGPVNGDWTRNWMRQWGVLR